MTDHSPEPLDSLRISCTYNPNRKDPSRPGHSFEPWDYENEQAADGYQITGHDGELEDRDWRRAVLCVNACAGIPTEELEKLGARAIRKHAHPQIVVRNLLLPPEELKAMKERPPYASHYVQTKRTDDILESL